MKNAYKTYTNVTLHNNKATLKNPEMRIPRYFLNFQRMYYIYEIST